MFDRKKNDLDEIFKQYINCIQQLDDLNKKLPKLLEDLKKSDSFQELKSQILALQKTDLSTLSCHSESYKLLSKLQQLQQHVQQFFASSLNIQEFLQQQLIFLKLIEEITAGYRKRFQLQNYSNRKKKHVEFVSILDQIQTNVQQYQKYQQQLLPYLHFLQNKQDGLQESVKEYIIRQYVGFHEILIKDSGSTIQRSPTTYHNSDQSNASEDRNTLEKEYAKLQTKYQELENVNAELITKNENLECENCELKTKNKELENGYGELETNNEDLKYENSELKTKTKELENKYRELETNNENLKNENRELEKKQELENEYRKLETNNETLKYKNRELETKNQELEHENSEVKTKNNNLEYQNRELKTKNNNLEYQNRELKTKNKELEHKNSEVKTKNENLKNENQELETKNQELENENKNSKVKAKNENLEYENRVLETIKKELGNENAELKTKNENLEKENRELVTKNKELGNEAFWKTLRTILNVDKTHELLNLHHNYQNLETKYKTLEKEKRKLQQFHETTRTKTDQDRQYLTNSNNSNSKQNYQYSNYSNFNQKYQDLEEENRNLQRHNQEIASKYKTLVSECNNFESKFNNQQKVIEELTKTNIDLKKNSDNLKKEATKYQSALGNATSFHLGNQDSDSAGQLSDDILELHRNLENFCGLKRFAIIKEPEIKELLMKYGFSISGDIQIKKNLISGLLERYVIETIIGRYNEYLKVQYHNRDIDQGSQNLEMKIINTTEQLLSLTKSFSEYRSGTDAVNKEHPLILKLRSEIIGLMNRFRTISKKEKLLENEAMINTIIRQVINIFLFRLKVQEPVAEWKFFSKYTSINTIMMSAPWDTTDLEKMYVDVCAFPVIGSNLCEANQEDKNMKVIFQAQ
ncbi:21318_t:CDS:2, partial [Gigaspora rosea]